MISFDFETRSAAPLKDCGAWVYSEHSSTDVICYSFAIDDGEPITVIGAELHPVLSGALADGHVFRAWNLFFEWAIWHNVCVPRYGWPALDIDRVMDTMALACVRNLPQGLEDCAMVLGQAHQKDKRGKQLIQLLSIPVGPKDPYYAEGEFRNDPALIQEMAEYCAQDVRVEREIAEHLGDPITDHERKVFRFTLEMNLRGLPLCLSDVAAIAEVVHVEQHRINQKLVEITGGLVEKVSQRNALLAFCEAEGHPLPDLVDETLQQALEDIPCTSRAHAALRMRDDANKSSVAKLRRFQAIVGRDGTAKGLSVYHGCSTGRYASRGGLNAQNLPRPYYDEQPCIDALTTGDHDYCFGLYGDDIMRAAVSSIRGMIRAPAGMRFLDADFSSIENRVGVWLPDQKDKIEMFRQGLDEYKVFASGSLYNIPYGDVTKDQRQMSKSAVLGCLFGQGWRGLIKYARGYGVELTDERSQEVVEKYREDYYAVRAMWYECEEKATLAVANPGAIYRVGGRLRIGVQQGFLVLRLPSGRRIHWYLPELRMLPTPWGTDKQGIVVLAKSRVGNKWVRQHLRGASIFQSAVQGTARDLMVDAAMRVDAAGYPVVLTVHDEILSLVGKNDGDENEFRSIMEIAPAWADGLPIKAESWTGERFRK